MNWKSFKIISPLLLIGNIDDDCKNSKDSLREKLCMKNLSTIRIFRGYKEIVEDFWGIGSLDHEPRSCISNILLGARWNFNKWSREELIIHYQSLTKQQIKKIFE
jgi:hypothetical protein